MNVRTTYHKRVGGRFFLPLVWVLCDSCMPSEARVSTFVGLGHKITSYLTQTMHGARQDSTGKGWELRVLGALELPSARYHGDPRATLWHNLAWVQTCTLGTLPEARLPVCPSPSCTPLAPEPNSCAGCWRSWKMTLGWRSWSGIVVPSSLTSQPSPLW